MLQMLSTRDARKVSPEHVADYITFSEQHHSDLPEGGLQLFERFYAARSLISGGMEAFLDATVSDPEDQFSAAVDACGVRGESITVVFCETETPDASLLPVLDKISRSENARAIVLAPPTASAAMLLESYPTAFETGKVTIELLGWFDDRLERSLQETLRLIDLLGNETRMTMLAPLFRKTVGKKDYRARINPKLVYQNLSVLSDAGLVDEQVQGMYELSRLGKSILAEFITFLEKTRRTLESASKHKEVKL